MFGLVWWPNIHTWENTWHSIIYIEMFPDVTYNHELCLTHLKTLCQIMSFQYSYKLYSLLNTVICTQSLGYQDLQSNIPWLHMATHVLGHSEDPGTISIYSEMLKRMNYRGANGQKIRHQIPSLDTKISLCNHIQTLHSGHCEVFCVFCFHQNMINCVLSNLFSSIIGASCLIAPFSQFFPV